MTRKELLLYTLQNQFLLEKAVRREVISGLCGLQAQFANNPRESLRIRAGDFSETAWNNGLLKIWTHRNTIHVVPKRRSWGFSSPPKAETGLGETGRPASRRRQNGTGHRLSGTRWPAASICGSLLKRPAGRPVWTRRRPGMFF